MNRVDSQNDDLYYQRPFADMPLFQRMVNAPFEVEQQNLPTLIANQVNKP